MPAQFESKERVLAWGAGAAGGAAEAIAFHGTRRRSMLRTRSSTHALIWLVRRPRQTEPGAEIIVRTVVIRSGGMAMAHSFRFALLLSAGLAVPAAGQVSAQTGTSNGTITSAPASTTTSIGSAPTPPAPTTGAPPSAPSPAPVPTTHGTVRPISPALPRPRPRA